MSEHESRFKGAFDDKVREALGSAKFMAFDGCHKIYLLMDDEAVAKIWCGYELAAPDYEQLLEWWNSSCGLRFINTTSSGGFGSVIGQCEYDAEEVSEKLYGGVAWCAEDVRVLEGCEDWSDEQCNEFLNDIEDDLQTVMIERGWDALEDLLRFYKEDKDVRTEGGHGQRGVQP